MKVVEARPDKWQDCEALCARMGLPRANIAPADELYGMPSAPIGYVPVGVSVLSTVLWVRIPSGAPSRYMTTLHSLS